MSRFFAVKQRLRLVCSCERRIMERHGETELMSHEGVTKGRGLAGYGRERRECASTRGRAAAAFGSVRWLGALSILLVLAAWTLVTRFAIVPEVLLPGPGEVAAAFLDILRNGYRETTLWQNGAATLWRCGAGFVLACL